MRGVYGLYRETQFGSDLKVRSQEPRSAATLGVGSFRQDPKGPCPARTHASTPNLGALDPQKDICTCFGRYEVEIQIHVRSFPIQHPGMEVGAVFRLVAVCRLAGL